MRSLFAFIAIAALGYGVWHYRSAAPPSAARVAPLLRDFLTSGDASPCKGSMSVTQLERISVGEYSEQLGGWPVYANHVEVCREGGNSTTYDGSHDAERKVAAAFIRRSGRKLELFIPGVFAEAQKQMQQSLQNALDHT